MFYATRTRAMIARVISQRPRAVLPLALVTGALLGAPFAGAAVTPDTEQSAVKNSGSERESANKAVYRPKISGRINDPRSIAGDGIRVRAIVTGIGRSRARVALKVRKPGRRAWRRVVSRSVRGGKKFALRWRGNKPGGYLLKISVKKGGRSDVKKLGGAHVFRRSHASYYGPGLYGGGLACGGRLSPSTVGVAHKTLPCGTRVTFNVGRRTVTTRVIDRGPFIAGRDWDLTAALKRKLGFGSTGSVNVTR